MSPDQMKNLKPTDLVRHKSSGGRVHMIHANYGNHSIGVHVAHVSNPIEWDLVRPDGSVIHDENATLAESTRGTVVDPALDDTRTGEGKLAVGNNDIASKIAASAEQVGAAFRRAAESLSAVGRGTGESYYAALDGVESALSGVTGLTSIGSYVSMSSDDAFVVQGDSTLKVVAGVGIAVAQNSLIRGNVTLESDGPIRVQIQRVSESGSRTILLGSVRGLNLYPRAQTPHLDATYELCFSDSIGEGRFFYEIHAGPIERKVARFLNRSVSLDLA